MYGWKKSGGGGGNKNKKVWLYGWDGQFFSLTDSYCHDYPDTIKQLDYNMEPDLIHYYCGITDWMVIPASRLGMPGGVKPGIVPFLVKDIAGSEILTGYDTEYKDGYVPGQAYLFMKVAKISKHNTNVPVDYHSLYTTSVLQTLSVSQNLHNVDVLKDLWESPIPGYGFGGAALYKHNNIYMSMGGETTVDPDETITGGIFPDGTPLYMVHITNSFIGPAYRTAYYFTPDAPISLGERDSYGYNPTNNLLCSFSINYLATDSYSAPVYQKRLNRYLLDMGNNELKDIGDNDFYYSFYGFVILGAK